MNRLLVCCRVRGAAFRTTDSNDLARLVGELASRASAVGGRVLAWDIPAVTFGFAADAIEDVVDLVAGSWVADEAGGAFSVGVSEGELSEVLEGGASVALSVGPGLSRVAGLARIAREGEVLLDPLLEVVASGELLTRGARLGTHGRQRIRGLVLDAAHPWRKGVAVSPSRLADPRFVGRAARGVTAQPGSLGVVIAERGRGGTRLLRELGRRGSSVLRLQPRPVGEPLGALRTALLRSRLASGGGRLSAEHEASIESLLAGEGLDLEASSGLLSAWMGSGSAGYLLLDDASEADADTLEALAEVVRDSKLRLLIRLDEGSTVPAALAELQRTFEIRVAALAPEAAVELALAFTEGKLDTDTAVRVARRGGGTALGLAEALREGLESGDLAWTSDSVAPRSRRSVQGEARAAEHWMLRRLRFLSRDARAVLDALVVLGGEASWSEIVGLAERAEEPLPEGSARLALDAGCWTTSVGDTLLALSSRSLRDLLERIMDPARWRAWHAAAASLRVDRGQPLAVGSATIHALACADLELARDLARRSAASARACGLMATAEAFDAFAERRALEPLIGRGLTGGRRFGERLDPLPAARSQPSATATTRQVEVVRAMEMEDEAGATGQVMTALRDGDFEAVQELTTKLRASSQYELLADRLDAMAALTRGEAGDALRLLRQSKGRSRELSAAHRCRAALALGVGLAAAGRTTEALLEALEGLGCAREANDVRGEEACARFLAQLSRSAGDDAAADVWAARVGGG